MRFVFEETDEILKIKKKLITLLKKKIVNSHIHKKKLIFWHFLSYEFIKTISQHIYPNLNLTKTLWVLKHIHNVLLETKLVRATNWKMSSKSDCRKDEYCLRKREKGKYTHCDQANWWPIVQLLAFFRRCALHQLIEREKARWKNFACTVQILYTTI